MKLYQSEIWLRRKYVKEGLSAKEISEMCGVTEMTITRYLTSFGLIRGNRTWSKDRR
jgi:transposase